MAQDLVLYEADAKIGIITLNRPDKLNALNQELRRELTAALTKADEDAATSVVVLRGAGRSFCVGYDIGGGGSGNEEWRHDALKYHARLSTSLTGRPTWRAATAASGTWGQTMPLQPKPPPT